MANMSGNSTTYIQKHGKISIGNFIKYIEIAKPDKYTFKTDSDCYLYDSSFTSISELKANTELKIITKKREGILCKGATGHIEVEVNNKRGWIRLSSVRKPTGKRRGFINHPLLKEKSNGVFIPFIADHDQEEAAVISVIESTDSDWIGEIDGDPYQVLHLGPGQRIGRSNPKTDVHIKIKNLITRKVFDYRISMKASNAVFFENWMLPYRFKQIVSCSNRQNEAITSLVEQGIKWKSGSRSNASSGFLFIGTKTFCGSAFELNYEEKVEAISGKQKFRIGNAIANKVYYGLNPGSMEEFIMESRSVSQYANDTEMWITMRSGNAKSTSALYDFDNNIINPDWTL